MALHVVQGERELVADCRSLARFELRGIPPMVAGAARIQVTFQVDADGLLSVKAREETSGVEASIDVKPSYGLADDEIARMLQEGFRSAEADMQARALREAQVEAERLLLGDASALAADGDLLVADERDAIDAADGRCRRVRRRRRPPRDRRRASRRWRDGTEAFAAERMNRGIRQALAGRSVEGSSEAMPIIKILPHPEYCPAGARDRAPRRAPRSAKRCSRTASRSSTPAR